MTSPLAARVLAAAAGTLAHAAVRADAPAPATDLPIASVTLYRSGVGYFERQGAVTGDARASLRFDAASINDVLKSLVLLDRGGGTVSTVGFSAKEPLNRRLASFAINLGDSPSIATMLSRLRGAKVRLATAEGAVEGAVLGIETRVSEPPPATPGALAEQPRSEDYLNLVTASGIRSMRLSRVSSFELLDPALAGELSKALEAIAERRDERTASLDLAFTGDLTAGARPVTIGYIHETPVWKTSYRLVLPDETAGKPILQGWAIVENTTDEDWKDVRLALASSSPVGFRMDLREPLMVDRPWLPIPGASIARSRTYEGDTIARKAGLADQNAAAQARFPAAARAAESVSAGAPLEADAIARYSPRDAAAPGEIGEQFRYQIASPVSIQRQRSAMLPLFSRDIAGERVSIYNPLDNAIHPMRGASITNLSGFDLAPGPIAVFDAGAYAGDAQIAYTPRNDERLLSYAVDTDVRIASRAERTTTINRIRIVKGLLEQATTERAVTTYSFANRDAKRPRTVLVEHPIKPGYALIKPDKPRSETASVRRFDAVVAPGAEAELSILEEQPVRSQIAVGSFDLASLAALSTTGKVSPEVAQAIRKAAAITARTKEHRAEIARATTETQAISDDQARIRQNMAAVGPSTELYGRLLKKLTDQETSLEALAAKSRKATEDLRAAQAELDDYLANLTLD